MKEEVPIFFYNTGKEDNEAMNAIMDANIKCKFIGPIEDDTTPTLSFESMTFYGVSGIESFIKIWKTRQK